MKFVLRVLGLLAISFVFGANCFSEEQSSEQRQPVMVTQVPYGQSMGQPTTVNVFVNTGAFRDSGNSVESIKSMVSNLVFLLALEAAGLIILDHYVLGGQISSMMLGEWLNQKGLYNEYLLAKMASYVADKAGYAIKFGWLIKGASTLLGFATQPLAKEVLSSVI